MENSQNKPRMAKIILDTNFLLIPGNFKVDIFSEIEKIVNFKYELIILDKSLEELNNIILKPKKAVKGADKGAVKVAFSLIENLRNNGKLNILPSKGHVDDDIVGLASREKSIEGGKGTYNNAYKPEIMVATQDQGLKRRLREMGIRRIVLKKKKYLAIEG